MTSRHAALTARMMARYGGTATLSRKGAASGDPHNPTPGAVTDYTVTLIETGAEMDFRGGTLVRAGDVVVAMLPHVEVSPVPGDVLTAGGVVYAVQRVDPVRSDPAGDVIHWRIEGAR